MKNIVILGVVLAWTAETAGQETRQERYFGTLEIGEYRATMRTLGQNAKIIRTDFASVLVDAAMVIDETKNPTWQWIGIRPNAISHVQGDTSLHVSSSSSVRFTDTTVELSTAQGQAKTWTSPRIYFQFAPAKPKAATRAQA